MYVSKFIPVIHVGVDAHLHKFIITNTEVTGESIKTLPPSDRVNKL